jgi:cysteine desulfurase
VEKLRNILENLGRVKRDYFCRERRARVCPTPPASVTPGWKGETQVMQMDLAGFAISAGSACSSGKVRSSRVLRAMGFDEARRPRRSGSRWGRHDRRRDPRFAEAWTAHHQIRARRRRDEEKETT